MACFGGGGGSSKSKAALNQTTDPQIASKPFLEVKLTLGNSHTRETVTLLDSAGNYLPGASGGDSAGGRPPKQPKLPAANDEEQSVQDAIKAITVSKASIERYKKDLEKIKATISVYNELYVQTSMEYYALANSVGVQLESSHDGQSEVASSHPSSGFISARRRHHDQLKKEVEHELEQTQAGVERVSEEKKKAAEEAEKLAKSIEAKKKALGQVIEVRSSAEASVKSGTDRAVDAQLRQSKENIRMSQENPIREVEERVSLVEKPEVARNTEDAKVAEAGEDEYGDEYYDSQEEEYEEEDYDASQSRSSKRSRTSSQRLQQKARLAAQGVKTAK